MMKILLATVALMCFAACNSDKNSDVPTTFADVTLPAAPVEGKAVTVTASLSNANGLNAAWLVYFLNGQDEVLATLPPVQLNGATQAVFTATIPAQAAGTKVTFQLVAKNMDNGLSASDIFTYTVQKETTDN